MQLTQFEVIQLLRDAGIYRPTWNIADNNYNTLDRDWVQGVAWPGWVDSLPAELVEVWPVGGGKTRRKPKWIAEVFDCDNHTQSFREYVIRCCAVDAVKKKTTRGGTPLGSLSYYASSNDRLGPHDTNWFIGHDRSVHWFEPAEGSVFIPLPVEVNSIWEGDAR